MMQYNTKHNLYIIISVILAFVMTLAGCTDDLIYNDVEIPDAEVELTGEVIFRPLVSTEVKTRSSKDAPEGTKYKDINSLYIFFFDKDGNKLGYSGEVNDFISASSEGSTHKRVIFKKTVESGKYYVYAVANISATQKSALSEVTTIDGLRKFKLTWDNDIENDLEMFGVFKQGGADKVPTNKDFEEDILITVTPKDNKLHSWVRRAVSKVTVDFDGTYLKDGVTVYIKSATLKDVPSGALLGASSAVGENDFICTTSDYTITYGQGEDHTKWPAVTTKITETSPLTPPSDWGVERFHDDNAKALPSYENMQGDREGTPKLQDSNNDGIIDSKTKDGVDKGTYLEVEGYYVSDRPEYKSQGKIIYRFCIGKNAENNFDLVRNHHYKITMRFKDYGNDIDWHIEYAEKVLDITYPQDVNYKGFFFEPDKDYYLNNGGHEFDNNNVITVTSYIAGTSNTWIEPDNITYTYYTHDDATDEWVIDNTTSGWLTKSSEIKSEDGTQKKYTFVASPTAPTSTTINSLFPTTPVPGSKDNPYNLSNKTGGSSVENTANCYMVGAPGWYCFPLVYGNAITDGVTNSTAYSGSIVNHLNEPINAPYIKDNTRKNNPETKIDLSDVSVKLIWQDADKLIGTGADELIYDSSLFDGKGGIKFHISSIKEGNAVIALIDKNAGEDEFVSFDRDPEGVDIYGTSGSTKAIWSWHIWATRFGTDDFEKDIEITNHENKKFDVMPVNLGWCSGDKAIKYYKRRKCVIKFQFGEHEPIERTIVQYPHLVLPRGDHPYYQWGRKDPFVGTNELWKNKQRWDHDGKLYDVWSVFNPPRLYKDFAMEFNHNMERKSTRECLDVLVKNPDKWLNADRKENPASTTDYDKFLSDNDAPDDLWSNGGVKTVYDPCPAGYQVSDNTAFTGFTTHGQRAVFPRHWYDVRESDMQKDYYTGSSINREVLELYTNPKKLQSITFPVSGYRDFDAKAQVFQYPNTGDPDVKGEGYIWFNNAKDKTNSYHFKFHRNDIQEGEDWQKRGANEQNLIAPYEAFYNTDGFGVRPVRIK